MDSEVTATAPGEAPHLGAAASGDPDHRWFVLHTRSRQEKALVADLRAMAVDCYLPLTEAVRYYGRRKARVALPLFPGYVFLCGSLDQAHNADRTRRVVQLIPVTDQVRFEQELANIRLALTRGAGLEPHPCLKVGTWVEVRSGPFRGLRGLIEANRKADRLVLQIQTLGQGSSLEIDRALLEPVEPMPTYAKADG